MQWCTNHWMHLGQSKKVEFSNNCFYTNCSNLGSNDKSQSIAQITIIDIAIIECDILCEFLTTGDYLPHFY